MILTLLGDRQAKSHFQQQQQKQESQEKANNHSATD